MSPSSSLPWPIAGGLLAACVLLLAALTVRWAPPVRWPGVGTADVDLDFTADEQRRERSFRRQVRPWGLAGAALGVLVPTALLLGGAVRSAADSDGPWWLQVLAVTTVVLVVGRAASLPGAAAVRRRSLAVGLAAGTWGRWWRDVAVAAALGWVLTGSAMVGWVAAARLLPQSWWWVLAVAAGLLVVLLSFVVPVVVEPLFARFVPLSAGPLRDRLLGLADAARVPVRDVLVADASRRTTALNAYVSGLGPTRRIVVHDTLVERGADDETAAVLAHELGHVVHRDVAAGTALGSLGAAAGVLAAALALTWAPLLGALEITGPADPAAAGLLLAGGAWLALLTAPLQNAVSRRVERRADEFGLDLARDPATVAAMHRSLAVVNLAPLRPVPLLHWWFGTHPTSPERIACARRWARSHGLPEVPGLAARG
jgi:STE24 endopeptidase